MYMYRRILKIPWTDKITNEQVLGRMNTTRLIIDTIKCRKAKYFGHVIRHMQKIMMFAKIEGKRPRGRPRLTWMDNIKEWTNCSIHECNERAQDRDKGYNTIDLSYPVSLPYFTPYLLTSEKTVQSKNFLYLQNQICHNIQKKLKGKLHNMETENLYFQHGLLLILGCRGLGTTTAQGSIKFS
ncbi:hypothetical protein GQR58_025940 [Nymphon striatum]|nr:hypothetical protein GQR58_025940 [Nymphon striatum]